jgi:hypothetical protein
MIRLRFAARLSSIRTLAKGLGVEPPTCAKVGLDYTPQDPPPRHRPHLYLRPPIPYTSEIRYVSEFDRPYERLKEHTAW